MPDGRFQVICGDCREVMAKMDPESVDCCVTSPPYFNLREYDGQTAGAIGSEETPVQYVADLADCLDGVRRILRRSGTLWLNVGDSFASRTVDGIRRKERIGVPFMLVLELRRRGWMLRQDIVWSKPNAMPESVRDRFACCHEYLFMLTKSGSYYFSHEDALEEAAEPAAPGRAIRMGGSKYGDSDDPHHGGKSGRAWRPVVRTVDGRQAVMRTMRDVWSVPTCDYFGEHCAVFPERLVDPCVRTGCPAGGTVIDPFSGVGTTGLAALRNGRKYIGIEVSPKYCGIQRERILKTYGGLS